MACRIYFCVGKVHTHGLEGLRPCILQASSTYVVISVFEKYELPMHKTLFVSDSSLVKNICYRI